jgi:predicted nucleic acid-binding protein
VTPSFVLDASMALAWCFREEATDASEKLLRRMDAESAIVPAWWFIEIVNVLAIAERKGRLKSSEARSFIEILGLFTLEVDNEAPGLAFTHLYPLCRQYSLTSYDAVYLELSLRRQLPLATLDAHLAKTAKKLGVPIIER